MKINRLEMRGIGTFKDHTVIDFDRFDAEGLFLIKGDTGAGKTTIIDAIVYALYGRVSGGDLSSESRIPSQYIGEKDPAEVRLTFTSGGKYYRITRAAPGRKAYSSEKRALLEELSDLEGRGPIGFSVENTPEVRAQLAQILPLDHTRFTQIGVLPQGKFAAFLTATSAERHKILSEIFDVSQFELMEQTAREEALKRRRQLDGAFALWRQYAQATSGCLEFFQASANPAIERLSALLQTALAGPQGDGPRGDMRAGTHKTGTAPSLEAAAQLLTDIAGAQGPALAAIEQVEGDLRARSEELSAKAAAATQAAAAARSYHEVLAEKEALQAKVAQASAQEAARQAELTEVASQITGAQAALTRLEDLVESEKQADSLRRRLQEHSNAISAAKEQLADLAGQIQQAPARQAHCREQLARARRASQLQPQFKLRGEAWRKLGQDLDAYRQARESLGQALAVQSTKLRALTQATSDFEELHQAWVAGQGAILAATLETGKPCPCCGSLTHPQPARGQDIVSEADRERAEQHFQACQAAHHEADAQVKQAQVRLEEILKRYCANWLELKDLQWGASEGAAQEVAAADLAELGVQVEGLDLAAADFAPLEDLAAAGPSSSSQPALELVEAILPQVERARAAQETATTRLGQQAHQCQALEAELAQADSQLAALQAQQQSLQVEMAGQEAAWQAANGQLAQLEERLSQGRGQWPTLKQALQAGRQELASLQAKSQAISAFLEDLRWGRKELSQERFTQVDRAQAPDLAAVEAAQVQAQQAYESALGDLAQCRGQHQSVAANLAQLTAQSESLQRGADQLEAWERVSRVLGGDNQLKVSLSSYYLSERLERIVEAANEQIWHNSRGRYELVRVDDAVRDASQKKGLGLHVRDQIFGAERSPLTLSGGEKFFFALALAIGLATVVKEENGGFSIDTVFIDEGFGSLDAEVLDLVMTTLHAQCAPGSGRSVGIISHVEELANQIGAQIKVSAGTPAHTGSKISVVGVD